MKSGLTSMHLGGRLIIVGRRSLDGGETWIRSRAHPWWARGYRLSADELSDRRLIEFGVPDPRVQGGGGFDLWLIKFMGVR